MKLTNGPVQTGSGAATKQDIEKLGEKLIWPPEFTRNTELTKMQELLGLQDKVMNDSSLTNTEKVLRVAEYKRQYNIHDNERFGPQPVKLGAVPPIPLTDTRYSSDGELSDTSVVSDVVSDQEEETELTTEELLKPIQPHRQQKAKLMLKKLAAEGSLKWDADGQVYYKGKIIEDANMGQLVRYFQTAHKKVPMDPPSGQVVFGEALRRADAMEDVQLGGEEDNGVREVFKGITPARFNPYQDDRNRRQRKLKGSINRVRAQADTVVTQLEL